MSLKEKPLYIILLCLVIIVGLIFFGLKPILSSIKAVNLEVLLAKREYQEKEKRLNLLKTIQANPSLVSENLALMKKALPKEEESTSDLLVNIEALSASSGVFLSAFTPAKTETPTTPSPTTLSPLFFDLSLSGSYPSFLTFLENVEKNLRPMTVKTINLTAGKEGVSATLKMVTFYQQ